MGTYCFAAPGSCTFPRPFTNVACGVMRCQDREGDMLLDERSGEPEGVLERGEVVEATSGDEDDVADG